MMVSVLTRYMPRMKVRKEKNLLKSKEEEVTEEEDLPADIIVPYCNASFHSSPALSST
jgi:hypothetical protein